MFFNNKKVISVLYIFFVLLFVVSCSYNLSKNIINGSFEEVVDNEPSGWVSNASLSVDNNVYFEVDKNVFHSGSNSILIELTGGKAPRQEVYKFIRALAQFETEKKYKLSGWIKVYKIKNSPYLEAECWNKNKMIGYASTDKIAKVVGNTKWENVETIFQIPKETTKVLILLCVPSKNNIYGKVWFDDIQVEKID
ncbi:carbohydrate binding domain-containing protein [Melioribacteraceae bacterium 4301-Me]|uniref:carbohydrate binding domain-containing protein n=1 Tax=Pyranulibacter aquaticus TaxID=3163344 RepID=UPI00359ACADC